ncbi:trigger factor [Anseongella ginsenosidimutans]|uniref:Trigger factor n=1 Tax=Anseongella ginsenosidimutans TaxID=496056 RepID=A0A4R3KQR7_9SPHI|nr:trigger factor [Anseongella ginsenosidimutans]QEC52878.1 trigger factor [Anseongella ginsenosidimutans]TCS87268.1 trigger factor [Anseongella ginsenosidimutans]
MNITQEKTGELNALVTINIEAEDYREQVEKAIKSYSKKVRIPGFRPGMVPKGHIKKLYGKSILLEEINNLLSDSLNNYISENKLEILGQPLPKAADDKEFKWDFGEAFDFSYELGLAPDFDAKFSDKDKFTLYRVKADEETVNNRIKNLRRGYGKVSNPEESAEGDVINGVFTQLATDKTVMEEGIEAPGTLRLELVEDKKILKSLTGLKEGDEVDIDLHKAFKEDASHKISHLLNIEEDIAKDLKSEFRLKVKGINRMEEAELNEEFFKKVFPEGDVSTEEEMREKVAKEVEDVMGSHADNKLQSDIYAHALEKFKIELPDDFLQRWLKATNENIPDEQIEKEYPDFAKNLRLTLLENKILKESGVEVKSEDIIALAKEKIAAQFRMYSANMPLTDEQLSEYAVNFLQDRERANQLYEEIRSKTVFEQVKSQVKLNEKEISYKDFLELK